MYIHIYIHTYIYVYIYIYQLSGKVFSCAVNNIFGQQLIGHNQIGIVFIYYQRLKEDKTYLWFRCCNCKLSGRKKNWISHVREKVYNSRSDGSWGFCEKCTTQEVMEVLCCFPKQVCRRRLVWGLFLSAFVNKFFPIDNEWSYSTKFLYKFYFV